MKHWINKNYKTLIIAAFLIPIITVAIVSISHVTQWYGLSNPITWAVYLSIGIEIAALSALAAISANMGKKVYFPFSIVTIIQFIGNIFFAYSYININNENFKMWVELVSPLLEFMGVESGDYVGHKRFLALFSGGMLPIISLSFLHMLIKFTEEDRLKEVENESGIDVIIDDGGISEEIKNRKSESNPEDLKNFVDESIRIRLSENDLKKLEEVLLNPPQPNENLKIAVEKYEDVKKSNIVTQPIVENRKEILSEIMQKDQELGLYDEPVVNDDFIDTPNESFEMVNEVVPESIEVNTDVNEVEPSDIPQTGDEMILTSDSDIIDSIPLDDDISHWDVTLMDGLDDEEIIFQEDPKVEEKNEIFSTITVNTENIFQKDSKVESKDINIEPIEDEEDNEMITKMRDIFFNDNEEEKKNLIEEPQTLTSSLVDSNENSNESLYWEKDDVDTNQDVNDLVDSDVTIENEIIEIPSPIAQEPIDVTRKVFSRNVNNTRRRNFR